MGNTRRIAKGMKQPIAISDTKVSVYGCQVLLGHEDGEKSTEAAKHFGADLTRLVNRSRLVTLSETFRMSIEMRKRILETGTLN